MMCGLWVPMAARWARQRRRTEALTGSSGTATVRWPTRSVQRSSSKSSTCKLRSSVLDRACNKARVPTSASCGWASAPLQRRKRRRCSVRLKVSPTKPHRDKLVSPLVGSTKTSLFLRAQPKKWREACRRRRRLEGWAPRNASISSTAITAHSCFDRSVAKKRARSRTMPRLCSMVMSLRGRVPALSARWRERTRW